jgi:pyrroloquinoline quinone (PQQ) biosynthesis protein C
MTSTRHATLDLLSTDQARQRLMGELDDWKSRGKSLSVEQVGRLLGQWYHPLHYFPEFLSRVIAVSPSLDTQSSISRILWQELGEGDPALAHETLYIETMTNAGFQRQTIAASEPLPNTAKLVEGYKNSTSDYVSGLGFLYGTEVVDLAMVSAMGHLIRTCTGKKELPWVDIHVKQEPDHVESSSRPLLPPFTEQERERIVGGARDLWTLWTGLFAGAKETFLS